MEPERIEELLRQRPRDEPGFNRPVPTLASPVVGFRVATGRSGLAAAGASVLLVGAVALIFIGSQVAHGPGSSPGASGSAPTQTSQPSGVAAIPWIDTRYVPQPPDPTAAPSSFGLCPADRTALLAGGWSGAGGPITGSIAFMNMSLDACRIEAPTGVVLFDASGNEAARNLGPEALASGGTVVPSGGVATAQVVWANWCGAAPAGLLEIAVTVSLGGDGAPAEATLRTHVDSWSPAVSPPTCDAPAEPSALNVAQLKGRPTLGGYRRLPCDSSSLRVFDTGWGAATGSMYGRLVIANASALDCDLPSQPTVGVTDAAEKLLLNQMGPTSSETALPAGATVTVELSLSDWCANPPSRPMALRFDLGSEHLPIELGVGDGEVPLPGCNSTPETPAPTFDVGPFVAAGASSEEQPVDPGDLLAPNLAVSIAAPTTVAPGDVVAFSVTLENHNPYGKPYDLAGMCPSYLEQLLIEGNPAVSERYLLNCDPAGVLAPGESQTFAMQIRVPVDAAKGMALLVWQLGQSGPPVQVSLSVE